ncbi:MAG: tetratricopeptide repeat protein, partial [Pedobacter sp.]|nr:tetratricopeptide repeat protein [Pedobacter sp.]
PEQASEPAASFDQGRYQLGYEVYLAAGNLPAAYRVAEKAVRERPADAAWRRRMAEVAQWLGQPEVALANWLELARQTGDAQAWREVGRIAPMLADDEAWLRYQQHEAQSHPGDSARINALLSAYERVGRPEEGLTYLAELRKRKDSRALVEAESLLAERVGQDEKALKDLNTLNRRYGWQEGWVLRAAGIHYQRGELDQANAVLAEAEPHMPDSAAGFWQTRAEVARLRADEATALAAYGHVHAGPGERELDLINYAALMQGRDPLAAARLQETAYRRYGKPAYANSALYLWVSQNQLPNAEAFLQSLTPGQLAQLEGDAAFHEFRGHLREAQGRWREAMADYAAGRRLVPQRQSLLAAWLSLYIQHAQASDLRRLLLEARAEAADTPLLWPLWAAGWSRLDQPVQALPYQQALYQQAPNSLLTGLAYADTLAAAGLPDAARALRQKLWAQREGSLHADKASQQSLAQALFILEWQQ